MCKNYGASGQPEPLTEKAQREASLPVDIYGESLVAGAFSKTWSYRENALLAVYKKLMEVPPGTPKAELRSMTRPAVFLCKKALTDKVSSLGKSEISHCVEQTWNNLLSGTRESTQRLRTLAITFIQEMALFKEVRALQSVPVELVRPVQSSLPTRLALSRLELLEKLLEQLGTKESGFTLDNVIQEKGKDNAKVPEKKAEKSTKSAGVKKINQSVPADAKGRKPSVANYSDNLGIFCGERDKSFTEDGLDLHYWKHCPMLQRCLQCRQVVEIVSLTECERKGDFTQCPLCSEALTRDKQLNMKELLAIGWKSHLMGTEGCKQNSRRRAVQQSTLSHAQGKTGSTAIAKTTMVISEPKAPGLSRGSRIPAPASRINRRSRLQATDYNRRSTQTTC